MVLVNVLNTDSIRIKIGQQPPSIREELAKTRLDVLLHEKRYFGSRQKAQDAIKAGAVLVDGSVIAKPGATIPEGANIFISREGICDYVSRGGIKLEHALKTFRIGVRDKTAIDIGASTGGFSDCLLSFGAKKIYAIDVGHGQMDESIAANEKVILMEGVNAKYLTPGEIARGNIDLAVIDVSFISLKKVLVPVAAQLAIGADIVCLVKPQFEIGHGGGKHGGGIAKNGVVKSRDAQLKALESVKAYASENGLVQIAETESPIAGGDGNKEFFLHLKKVD